MVRDGRLLSILLVTVIVAMGCLRVLKMEPDDTLSDAHSDDTISGNSNDCDCFAEGLSGATDAAPSEQEGEQRRRPALDNGCIDTDSADNYLKAGYVVYTDENGLLVLLYDECKLDGPNGMLKEITCEGYHGPDTDPSEMEAKYIKCNCQQGECVEDSVILCTDPEADVPYPGGSVWTNDEGKTHISVCLDSNTVDWYYCNEDGTFHADASACDPESLCGDGMCGGFVCTDTEPPEDRLAGVAGKIFLYSPTTGESWLITDGCSYDRTEVNTFTCPLQTGTKLLPLKEEVKLHPVLIPCDEGEECHSGACEVIESTDPDPGTDPDPNPVPESCVDNDPDDNIYVAGQVVYTSEGGEPQFFPDKCAWYYEDDPENPGTLLIKEKVKQYKCSPNEDEITSSLKECFADEACIGGACIGESSIEESCDFVCFDSDDGKDVLEGGFVYATSETCGVTSALYDHCTSDPHVITERYCSGDLLAKQNIPCPQGHFCRTAFEYASCIACKDSDKADDPAVFGEVDDIDGSHVTDFCNAAGQLKQVGCDPSTGLAIWADPENCAPGESCSEGKCN